MAVMADALVIGNAERERSMGRCTAAGTSDWPRLAKACKISLSAGTHTIFVSGQTAESLTDLQEVQAACLVHEILMLPVYMYAKRLLCCQHTPKGVQHYQPNLKLHPSSLCMHGIEACGIYSCNVLCAAPTRNR